MYQSLSSRYLSSKRRWVFLLSPYAKRATGRFLEFFARMTVFTNDFRVSR